MTGAYFLSTAFGVTRYGWNGRLLNVGFRPGLFQLDGTGGYLMWGLSEYPYRYVVVRTTSDGYLMPGWPSGGRQVSTPEYNLRQLTMGTDGAGGSIFALEDSRPTTLPAETADLYIQWLLPDGTPSPAQTPSGELLAATPWDESLFGAVENFAGDMIFGWSDTRNGNRDLWAYRFNTDLPVPTALALVSSTATSGAVTLHWHAVDLEPGSEIQRRSPSGSWQVLAAAIPDGDGDIRYVDRDVRPGARYGYRILVGGAGLGEIEIEVPRADRTMLAGATRNPAYDGVSASFSLAGDVPASVRLLDVTGREVARATARPTGGWQVVDLAGAGELAPGLYMIQLDAGGELHHRKVLVLR